MRALPVSAIEDPTSPICWAYLWRGKLSDKLSHNSAHCKSQNTCQQDQQTRQFPPSNLPAGVLSTDPSE